MSKILVVIVEDELKDGVVIGEMFPSDFFDLAAGKATVNVDKVRAEHAAAGGPGAYLDQRPIYRLMPENQRRFYITVAPNKRLVNALRVAGFEARDAANEADPTTADEPWEPEPVT